jgi:hypothetical protein
LVAYVAASSKKAFQLGKMGYDVVGIDRLEVIFSKLPLIVYDYQ